MPTYAASLNTFFIFYQQILLADIKYKSTTTTVTQNHKDPIQARDYIEEKEWNKRYKSLDILRLFVQCRIQQFNSSTEGRVAHTHTKAKKCWKLKEMPHHVLFPIYTTALVSQWETSPLNTRA